MIKKFFTIILLAFVSLNLFAVTNPSNEIKVGVLKFGTANWELKTTMDNGIDAKHNFKLNTCPQNYKKIINSDNTQCKSNNPDEMSFYLNGNNTLCSDEKKQTNGCFNEIKLKKDKCNKIKNFFSNQDILNSWHQYQTECNS